MNLEASSFMRNEGDEKNREGDASKNTRSTQNAERRLSWANTISSRGKSDSKHKGDGIRGGNDWKEREASYRSQRREDERNLDEGASEDTKMEENEDKIPEIIPKIVRHSGSMVEILDGENKVKVNGEPNPLNSFKELSFALAKALGREYSLPTVIQKYCIPSIIEGKDLICRAPTGMGKTMCFLIPIIQNYKPQGSPQACIISPTRELCEQIRVESMKLIMGTRIRVASIYGKKQDLPSYSGVDIIVATPGRLLDLLKRGRVDFSGIGMFVLDEADKLLDMGFEEPIKEIRSFVPQGTQTCLFSATYSPKLTRVINYFLPGSRVSVEIMSETLKNIRQEVMEVSNKKTALLGILQSKDINLKGSWRTETQPDKILVFVERKSECGELERILKKKGISCVTLHGDKEQVDRNEALKGFRDGGYPVMVATSVAARGIDVKDIKLVINYDIPKDIKEYIHRIGRTGREGKAGKSISFYDSNVSKEVRNGLIDVLKESKNQVPGFLVDPGEDFNERFERLKIAADKEVSDDEEVGLW